MSRVILSKNSFKRDFKRASKQGLIGEAEILELEKIAKLLANDEPLDVKYKDHPLKHDYIGFRDLHIKPNLVLIYKITADCLYLTRIGRHSDLFKKYS